MADVSITAANVIAGANAKFRAVRFGATVTAGQYVYEDTSDNMDCKLADANSATAHIVAGVATGSYADGQWGQIIYEDDDFTPGGTLSITASATSTGIYVLSATAGGIAPATDAVATMYPVVLGVAKSTTKMNFKPLRAGVVLA